MHAQNENIYGELFPSMDIYLVNCVLQCCHALEEDLHDMLANFSRTCLNYWKSQKGKDF